MCSRDLAENRKGVAMNLQTLFIVCVTALGGRPLRPSPKRRAGADEGLVALQSWNLDELYLRPNAELAGYRKVLIDRSGRSKQRLAEEPELHAQRVALGRTR